mgnify:CR=1 FL=1
MQFLIDVSIRNIEKFPEITLAKNMSTFRFQSFWIMILEVEGEENEF